jgi:hypothetical protein
MAQFFAAIDTAEARGSECTCRIGNTILIRTGVNDVNGRIGIRQEHMHAFSAAVICPQGGSGTVALHTGCCIRLHQLQVAAMEHALNRIR